MISTELKNSLLRLMMMDIDQLNAERMELNRRERVAAFFDPNLYLLLIFGALLVVMMLNGCAESEEGPKGESGKGAEFTAIIGSEPLPNKYFVDFKWKASGEKPLGWFIKREEEESGKETLTTFEQENTSFTDSRVSPGKTYRYEFGEVKNIGNVKRAEKTLTIRFDLEVNGTVTNPKVANISRLFLKSGARLQTMGQALTLNVDEIISEDGAIETFPESHTAVPEANGSSGNRIEIRARKAVGTLHIYGRGENGGPGLTGKKGATGKRGKEGHYALSTCERVDVVCNCGQRAHELEEQAKRGELLGMMQFMMEKARHRCITQTSDGEIGVTGEQGGTGGNGGKGGDSAQIHVEISDPASFDLKAYPLPGAGGSAGAAGEGGEGGPGGDAGSRSLDRYYVCRDAHPGPQGAKGPKGSIGKTGEPGRIHSMCLVLGNSRFGDCNGK